jgi:hypothetical protein
MNIVAVHIKVLATGPWGKVNQVLRSFRRFAWFRTKAAFVVLAAGTALGFGAGNGRIVLLKAQAPAADRHTWKVYTNVRFQYSICYPQDLLVPQGESENSDGQRFLGKDGAKLVVFGRNNVLNEPLKNAQEETGTRLVGASGKVTYKAIKPGWFVVSGQKERSVFYAKTLYAHKQFKSFELTYDSRASAVYKPVITRLVGCFVNTGR